MKKLVISLLVFLVVSLNSNAQVVQRLDSFYVKYSGTALRCDSLLVFSKPEKFKTVEYSRDDYGLQERIVLLIGQELISISEENGKRVATSITMVQSHDEIKDGIQLFSLNNYKEYSNLLGTEPILGYMCSIYEKFDGNKIWVYKNHYVLKAFDIYENKETTAYEFQPNAIIDDKVFEIPLDVEVRYIQGK